MVLNEMSDVDKKIAAVIIQVGGIRQTNNNDFPWMQMRVNLSTQFGYVSRN